MRTSGRQALCGLGIAVLAAGCGRARPQSEQSGGFAAEGLLDGIARAQFAAQLAGEGPAVDAPPFERELRPADWRNIADEPASELRAGECETILVRLPMPGGDAARRLRIAVRLASAAQPSAEPGAEGGALVCGALQFAAAQAPGMPDVGDSIARSFSGASDWPGVDPQTREFTLLLDPRTVDLVLFARLEDAPLGAPAVAVLEALVVEEPALAWRVGRADLGWAPGVPSELPGPRVDEFESGVRVAHGLALPAGMAVEWPARLPADGEWLELAFGLELPAASYTGRLRDERCELRLTFEAPGCTPVELLAEPAVAVAGEPRRPAGWSTARAALPEHLRGARGVLRASVSSDLAGSPRLPVLAGLRAGRQRRAEDPPNVVLVSLDTLRADHLGAYGYARPTSPNIDALAERSTLFETCWSTGAYTLPSHVSLFSGQYPGVHRVHTREHRPLPALSPYLSELFSAAGYATAAFTGGGYVMPRFGFARGFDLYDIVDPALDEDWQRTLEMLSVGLGVDPEWLSGRGLRGLNGFLAEHRDERFFAFVHTYAAHELAPPERLLDAVGADPSSYAERPDYREDFLYRRPLSDDQLRWAVDRYDGGIRQADELIGELLAQLEALDLDRNTVVVVTSDHGKELGERGRVFHGHQLHAELVSVPLLVHVPGAAAARRADPASIVDLLPTLCGLAGIAAPPAIQGRDLLAEPSAGAPVFAELEYQDTWRALLDTDGSSVAWIEARAGVWTARDFGVDDPRQLDPRPGDPARTGAFQGRLTAVRRGRLAQLGLAGEGAQSGAGLRAGELELLEALGYRDVAGESDSAAADPSGGSPDLSESEKP